MRAFSAYRFLANILPLIPKACQTYQKQIENEKFNPSAKASGKGKKRGVTKNEKFDPSAKASGKRKKRGGTKKGPFGQIGIACELLELPSCACAGSDHGDTHASSCEGLYNLPAAEIPQTINIYFVRLIHRQIQLVD